MAEFKKENPSSDSITQLVREMMAEMSVANDQRLVGDREAAGVGGLADPEMDRGIRNELENEVQLLKGQVKNLQDELRKKNGDNQPARTIVPRAFLKPRDIPVLELQQLSGVEGAGRLSVFLSQVESCTQDPWERRHIVHMRVDAPLALFVQNIMSKGSLTWDKFKQRLASELTDQREERIYDSLNELTYNFDEDPVEFVSKLKCKLALLEIQTSGDDVPKAEKLIKNKLLKGMPKASRERLELYLDENITLKRFLDKLDTERLVVLSQKRDSVRLVEPPTPTVAGDAARSPTPAITPPNRQVVETKERYAVGDQRYSQGNWRTKYCPYCRATNHSVAECFRNPRPGSCYDCLRSGCRRGNPGCPGRINMTRGRLS